jgi:uroporphyrinogen decarboxylase
MRAAIDHKPVDRVPTDIWATEEVFAQLHAHFGADTNLLEVLHIDGFANISPRYVGPPLPAQPADCQIDYWGIINKRVSHGSGVYYEQIHWPLAHAQTIDDLERYAWPRPEWFDCSQMHAQALQARQSRLVMCGYMAPFYYHNLLRGLETSLMDPLDDPAFTHHYLTRLTDSFLAVHRKYFQSCDGLIDLAHVTDDLGSQTGPLMSQETFDEFYRPQMQRCIDLCREFGVQVFHHDDGAIRPFLPKLITMGIKILNPIQHTCPGMDMAGLKADFGKFLCFHGGIDNQHVLPFGTPEQVRQAVREAIDTLACDHTGYILAPCHNLQSNTPLANILALYDEAWKYGKFK